MNKCGYAVVYAAMQLLYVALWVYKREHAVINGLVSFYCTVVVVIVITDSGLLFSDASGSQAEDEDFTKNLVSALSQHPAVRDDKTVSLYSWPLFHLTDTTSFTA